MGKNQHSKDTLHQRPTEWAQDGAGFKSKGRNPFARLPLDCCSLSLQPFDNPVGARDGAVFDATNIIPYIKRFGVNPVSGAKLVPSELVPLHFHKDDEGKMQCPVTFKTFTAFSRVVANMVSGHVYSWEAVEELNRKPKNFTDLITSQKFKMSDIATLQDPDDCTRREISKFHYIQKGQQDLVVKEITHRESAESLEAKQVKIRKSAALERIAEAKQEIATEKEKEKAEKEALALENGTAPEAPVEEDKGPKRINDRFTDGAVAESFTSTATPLRTQNDLRVLTEEEEQQDIYDEVRKKKQKGYVRIITSEGMLNIELHTDIVPRTTDNFLRLCEREYYSNTTFHRLIQNFCIQGGDPTGTGRGGKSAYADGKAFRDEFDSRLSHQGPGVVSMANGGKNDNKSQFFVSLKSCQHLDNKHSVFGRVVGGLKLLDHFNTWETDEKDKPVKEIKLIRTEVFKNPFKEARTEAAKPKVEKVVEPLAQWFSNRIDPMEGHHKRQATGIGKYLESAPAPLPGEKKRSKPALPAEELEYANALPKSKKARTTFDFSSW